MNQAKKNYDKQMSPTFANNQLLKMISFRKAIKVEFD